MTHSTASSKFVVLFFPFLITQLNTGKYKLRILGSELLKKKTDFFKKYWLWHKDQDQIGRFNKEYWNLSKAAKFKTAH